MSPRELGRQAFRSAWKGQLLQSWSSRRLGSRVSWLCARGLSSLVSPGGGGAGRQGALGVPPLVWFGVRVVLATACTLSSGLCRTMAAPCCWGSPGCAVWVPGLWCGLNPKRASGGSGAVCNTRWHEVTTVLFQIVTPLTPLRSLWFWAWKWLVGRPFPGASQVLAVPLTPHAQLGWWGSWHSEARGLEHFCRDSPGGR